MRKITILILLIGFGIITVYAQKEVSDMMYRNLQNNDDVTYLSLSNSLLGNIELGKDTKVEASDGKEVTGELKEVKLAIYKPNKHPEESFKSTILRYLKKGRYELVEDEDGDEKTEVWVHRKGKKVYECHVIFQGEKNALLMSFLGDFKITDVDKLKEKIEDYK